MARAEGPPGAVEGIMADFEPIPFIAGEVLSEHDKEQLSDEDLDYFTPDTMYGKAPCGCKFYAPADDFYLYWKQCITHAEAEDHLLQHHHA